MKRTEDCLQMRGKSLVITNRFFTFIAVRAESTQESNRIDSELVASECELIVDCLDNARLE